MDSDQPSLIRRPRPMVQVTCALTSAQARDFGAGQVPDIFQEYEIDFMSGFEYAAKEQVKRLIFGKGAVLSAGRHGLMVQFLVERGS